LEWIPRIKTRIGSRMRETGEKHYPDFKSPSGIIRVVWSGPDSGRNTIRSITLSPS
jgi:hypothetical protein